MHKNSRIFLCKIFDQKGLTKRRGMWYNVKFDALAKVQRPPARRQMKKSPAQGSFCYHNLTHLTWIFFGEFPPAGGGGFFRCPPASTNQPPPHPLFILSQRGECRLFLLQKGVPDFALRSGCRSRTYYFKLMGLAWYSVPLTRLALSYELSILFFFFFFILFFKISCLCSL